MKSESASLNWTIGCWSLTLLTSELTPILYCNSAICTVSHLCYSFSVRFFRQKTVMNLLSSFCSTYSLHGLNWYWILTLIPKLLSLSLSLRPENELVMSSYFYYKALPPTWRWEWRHYLNCCSVLHTFSMVSFFLFNIQDIKLETYRSTSTF